MLEQVDAAALWALCSDDSYDEISSFGIELDEDLFESILSDKNTIQRSMFAI